MLRPITESRAAFAAAHDCASADDLDQLLGDDAIDALVLATPHSRHLPLIEAAAEAGTQLTPRQGWRGDPSERPLGGMTALGVHMVDTIRYLAGPVRDVFAAGRQLPGGRRLDDITTADGRAGAGALA